MWSTVLKKLQTRRGPKRMASLCHEDHREFFMKVLQIADDNICSLNLNYK